MKFLVNRTMSLQLLVFFCILLKASAERMQPASNKVQISGRQGRILGGSEATPHEFPYIVSIDNYPTPQHFCGGVILKESWVITAGHCIDFVEGPKFYIMAGKHSLSTDEKTAQVIEVDKVFIHEKYPGKRVVAAHDIALLKLKQPLVFNDVVKAIDLPDKGSDVTGKVIFSGWGKMENNISPNKLRRTELNIIDFDACQKADIAASGFPSAVTHTNICTSSRPEGIFACSGDSGGPLVQWQNCKLKLVGVFSWLTHPCGNKAPSVFTKVSLYNDWIKDIIDKNS